MLKFLDALNQVYQGKSVISLVSMKLYTPELLGINWCGAHYASYNAVFSEEERRGQFNLV